MSESPTPSTGSSPVASTALIDASRAFVGAANRTNTLYELSADYVRVLDLLEDPDADEEQLEAQLDDLAGKITQKAEAIAGLVTHLDGMAAMRKAEAQRLRERAASDEKHAARLRAYVLRHMQAIGSERIDTARYTVSIRQNPPAVEVLEEMLVPEDFLRVKVIKEVDKKTILEHFKSTGELVPGTEVVRRTRLDIR